MDEELLVKQSPHSVEAEQAVLGSILIDSRCLTDVIGVVRPEDFYLQQNREIYETIYTMFNFSQSIDPVTVLDKMRELGVHHDNSRDYIMQLMKITPTAANAVQYANIVKDKAMLRALADASTDISQMVQEQVGTTAEILEVAEKKIYAIRKGERGDSLEPIGVTLHKVFDHLTELSQSDSAIPGMSTGMRDLDKKINGLNKSDLLELSSTKGMLYSAKKASTSSRVTESIGRIRLPLTGAIPPRPFRPVPRTRCIKMVSALSSAVWAVAILPGKLFKKAYLASLAAASRPFLPATTCVPPDTSEIW